MPKLTERLVPVGAVVSALSTFLCCVPLPFAGAIGAASLGAAIAPFRYWLMGFSVILLSAGFAQVYREPHACRRQGTASIVILWTSAILLAVVLVLPQLLPTMLADWLE